MPLILSLSTLLLPYSWLTISYNCPTITSYKSVSPMLVSPLVPKVVAAVGVNVTSALGGILFDLLIL